MTLLTVVTAALTIFSCTLFVTKGHPDALTSSNGKFLGYGINLKHRQELLDLPQDFPLTKPSNRGIRTKRMSDNIIEDCISMKSDEGDYYFKASTADGTVCGVYLFGEPDQKIEVHFNYLNVPCENGGLVSFVDGWELNAEYFPSPRDHPQPLNARFSEFCGQKKMKQIFSSSQNVALIRYRMPAKGASFSFSVKFKKDLTPCNVLFQSTDGIYTLKNYGKHSNCSISTLFPSAVRVLSLNVGIVPVAGRGLELETGTIYKVRYQCQKRGLDDYVQIGGSAGLDNTNLIMADSVCGLDSKAGKMDLIACGTTTIRLVSSGAFDNSITVAIRKLTEENLNDYMSVICPLEELTEK